MQGLISEVLAAWREAERVVTEHPEGPDHDRAVLAVEQLRALYAELTSGAGGQPDSLRARLEAIRVRRRPENAFAALPG